MTFQFKNSAISTRVKAITLVSLSLPLAVVSVLSYSLLFDSWGWSRVPVMNPRFGDLRLVTSAATCIQEDNWSLLGPTCDPFGRRFNYLPIWAESFAFLGLGESDTVAVGLVFGFVVIAVLVIPLIMLIRKGASLLDISLASLAVLSPPVALQLERGNTEAVILFLAVIAALLVPRFPQRAAGFLGLATGLKFIPIFTASVLLRRSSLLGSFSAFMLAFGAVVVLNAGDVLYIIEAQEPPGEYRFGPLLLIYHFVPVLLNFPRLWVLAAGVSLTLIPALLFWFVARREVRTIAEAIGNTTTAGSLALVGGLVFMGTYFSGSRYDYSQIFLVVTLSALVFVVKRIATKLWFFGFGLLSLWGAFSINPESVIGDIATSVTASMIIPVIVQNRIDALRDLVRVRTG